jgi:hypothetical protein
MTMAALVLLLFGGGCLGTPITPKEALALVLHVPNARMSAHEKKVRLSAEIEQGEPNGWVLRVYATNSKSPSNLIGYYLVDRTTAEIRDYSIDKKVSSRHLKRQQKRLLAKHCPAQ